MTLVVYIGILVLTEVIFVFGTIICIWILHKEFFIWILSLNLIKDLSSIYLHNMLLLNTSLNMEANILNKFQVFTGTLLTLTSSLGLGEFHIKVICYLKVGFKVSQLGVGGIFKNRDLPRLPIIIIGLDKLCVFQSEIELIFTFPFFLLE